MTTICLTINFIGMAALLFQCGVWLFVFRKLMMHNSLSLHNPVVGENMPGLSILICARNESENLRHRLPKVLEQSYHGDLEVLVLNDRSSDNTLEVLEGFQKTYEGRLKIVTISQNEERNLPGKKMALARAIASAKHDILLLTDADCIPASPHWATNMVGMLSEKIEIVLGYGAYQASSGPLNKIVQYETQWTATQYLSLALSGSPYMGVGRNLLYRRSLFHAFVPNDDYRKLLSGDDDLFVNAVAKSDNVAVCIAPDAFTISAAPVTWAEWMRQKQRHVSAGAAYNIFTKIMLGSISLSHIVTYTLLISPLFCCTLHLSLWVLLCVRILLVLHVSWGIAQKLKTGLRIGELALLDVLYLLYYPIFFSSLFYSTKSPKDSSWKKNT